jgi:hypothetical protein
MRAIDHFVMKETKNLISLLEKKSKEDENVEMLYTKRLKPILQSLLDGHIRAPSTALEGYGYYFMPEGPWSVWERFPDLAQAMSVLSNALRYSDDAAFHDYCLRCGVPTSGSSDKNEYPKGSGLEKMQS